MIWGSFSFCFLSLLWIDHSALRWQGFPGSLQLSSLSYGFTVNGPRGRQKYWRTAVDGEGRREVLERDNDDPDLKSLKRSVGRYTLRPCFLQTHFSHSHLHSTINQSQESLKTRGKTNSFSYKNAGFLNSEVISSVKGEFRG